MTKANRYDFVGLVLLIVGFSNVMIAASMNGFHNNGFLAVAGMGIVEIVISILYFFHADKLREDAMEKVKA